MKRRVCRRIVAAALAAVCCMVMADQTVLRRDLPAEATTIAELEAQKAENNRRIQEYDAKL
ncbi:MAG: hypothetical protein IKN55_00085, partial [Oscillospiraceae bacterium]|nr:hypothetical protein [Oscillospiraceae bacterium]